MMGGMAANSYSRKLSDHIYNFNHEVERERELEVGEVVNSQRPAPVMFLLQQGCIPPTQTVPPYEDQVLQHLSLWGGALLIQNTTVLITRSIWFWRGAYLDFFFYFFWIQLSSHTQILTTGLPLLRDYPLLLVCPKRISSSADRFTFGRIKLPPTQL